jgi:transcriptional regulator with XRE-family HTH domain
MLTLTRWTSTPASRRFGRTVADLRTRRGLTQEALAARTQLSRGYLAQLEIGYHANPTLTTLRRLARALEVPVTELVE